MEHDTESATTDDTLRTILVTAIVLGIMAYYDLNFIEYIGVIVGGALVGNIIGEIWKKAWK